MQIKVHEDDTSFWRAPNVPSTDALGSNLGLAKLYGRRFAPMTIVKSLTMGDGGTAKEQGPTKYSCHCKNV